MQRLMVAGAGCKLALSIATNTTVLCMLYGCMMGNYDGLYLPMMVLGYVFSVPFFLLTVRTSQKQGQKASLMKYVSVAFLCYIGVLVLLLLWGKSDAFTLSIMGENGLSINLYTILFIAFFGIGYGAYYATADMPIPMVADCSDYETYRSGKYIPGIMGTLFSLGGHRAVLHHPHGGMGCHPHRHERLQPDRREDERDPGCQRLPPRRRGQRYEAGGRHDQVADPRPAASRVPRLRAAPLIP